MKRTAPNSIPRSLPATLRDVAEMSGVSIMVASRALRGETMGKRRDALARVAHIREVASQLNYRRDLAASATRQGRFGSVALVLSAGDDRRSHLPPTLLKGLTDALDQRDMHLSIARLTDESLTDTRRIPRLLRDLGVDGLLVNYNQWVPPAMEHLIEAYGIPAVWLNDKRSHNAVFPDDLEAGQRACDLLLQQGHRRICYIGHPIVDRQHYSEADRKRGYENAMRTAGLSPNAISEPRSSARCELFRAWRRAKNPPTAIISYNARIAATLRLSAMEQGLRCPQDFALVTFSGEPARLDTGLTALQIPDEQVGRDSVDMLLNLIASGSRQASVSISFQSPEELPYPHLVAKHT